MRRQFLPLTYLSLVGREWFTTDCQHHSICSGACDADSGDKMSNPVQAPTVGLSLQHLGAWAALLEKDPGLTLALPVGMKFKQP